MVIRNKATRQNQLRQLMAGIDKHFTGVTSVTLGGADVPLTQLKALFQGDVDASDASVQAKANLATVVQQERNTHVSIGRTLRLFKSYVDTHFGDTNDASGRLSDLGTEAGVHEADHRDQGRSRGEGQGHARRAPHDGPEAEGDDQGHAAPRNRPRPARPRRRCPRADGPRPAAPKPAASTPTACSPDRRSTDGLVHRRRGEIKAAAAVRQRVPAGASLGFGRSPREKPSAPPAREASAIAVGDWSHLDGGALVVAHQNKGREAAGESLAASQPARAHPPPAWASR